MVYKPMNLPDRLQAQYYRDPQLQLANRLILQGSSTDPVQHWTQGLGRLAQALAGTYISGKANKEYEERGQKYAEDMGTIMAPQTINASEMDPQGGSRPATMAEMLQRASSVRNPDLGPLVQNLALTAAGQASEDQRFNTRSRMEDERWKQRFETEDQRRQRERGEDRTYNAERDARMFANQRSLAQIAADNRNPTTIDLADGKYILNRDGTLGPRLGDVYQRGTPTAMTPVDRTQVGQALGVPVQANDPLAGLPPKVAEAASREQIKQTEKALAEMREAVQAGRASLADYKRFEQLMGQQETGGIYGAPVIGPAARAIGGWADPAISEMTSIADRITPQMRQPGSGATSDFDARMFQSATVGVGKPPEANKNLIQAAKAAQTLQQDRLGFMESYATANGGSLRGADQAWQQYLDANPIFDPESPNIPKINEKRQTYQQFFGGRSAQPATNNGWSIQKVK